MKAHKLNIVLSDAEGVDAVLDAIKKSEEQILQALGVGSTESKYEA